MIGRVGALGKTILVGSNMMTDLVGLCDRIGVLHEGRLIARGRRRDRRAAGGGRLLETKWPAPRPTRSRRRGAPGGAGGRREEQFLLLSLDGDAWRIRSKWAGAGRAGRAAARAPGRRPPAARPAETAHERVAADFPADRFWPRGLYVGAMKGEILRRAPEATVVDLCHGLAPQDVAAGAFGCGRRCRHSRRRPCSAASRPGVGGAARAVGADRDFSSAGRTTAVPRRCWNGRRISSCTKSPPLSCGRRAVFNFSRRACSADGGAAGAQNPFDFGPKVSDPVRLNLDPEEGEGWLRGRVMIVDRFGNWSPTSGAKNRSTVYAAFEIRAGALRMATISRRSATRRRGLPSPTGARRARGNRREHGRGGERISDRSRQRRWSAGSKGKASTPTTSI